MSIRATSPGRAFLAIAVLFSFAAAANAQLSVGRRVSKPAKASTINSERLLKDIEYLSSDAMRGRRTGSPESLKAREFIVDRFRDAGLKMFGDSFIQEFTFTRRGQTDKIAGANVVGYIKGKKHPEKYIVVSAHYDHVGVQNGEIYNGADDNASGTAALLAIAERFMKERPRHSIIFVAFDAEEQGLQGSRYFVANLPVKKESIVLNVNMDMLARNDKGELYAAGRLHYPQFSNVLTKVQKAAKIKLLLGHDVPGTGQDDWTSQSDHAAFHREKIPFLYFGVENHKDYHRPTDDFANIQPEFYVKAVETVLGVIREIDRQTWGSGIGVSFSN